MQKIQNQKLNEIFRLNEKQKEALKKLSIHSTNDLLLYFPSRYQSSSEINNILSVKKGDNVLLFGKILKLETSKGFKTKITMAKATLKDESGEIPLVWFHQPYIAKMLSEGTFVKVEGIVAERNGKLYIGNPKVEKINYLPLGVGNSLFKKEKIENGLFPIYKESKGLSSLWFFHHIQKLIQKSFHEQIEDVIPKEILKKYHLPSLKSALVWIHTPKNEKDMEVARKRFAFEEIFLLQIKNQQDKKLLEKEKGQKLKNLDKDILDFKKRFGFKFTDGQDNAIKSILKDFESGIPMSRLLNGDVGSGKTAVAATTAFGVVNNKTKGLGHLQVAYMTPTEILAKQHFESFCSYFKGLNIPIALLTGKTCRKFPSKVNPEGSTRISKNQLLKWVKEGSIAILIGTHTLIQKSVVFKNLSYVIIDEQHRFGTKQRKKLAQKDGSLPHLLSMTATPIPRTLALTIYGNLDISVLDQMPFGRKPIITEVVLPQEREKTYEKIKKELKEGRQAYIICPRIEEPDPDKVKALYAKSVKAEAKRLSESVFKEYKIDILHSKMLPVEKDIVMQKFSEHKIDILVATSVVEVGVNVPNATVIIIEGGERFGLSQLHQLRGRVIRGNHQAYCYVFAETKTEKTKERLLAFKNAKDGFELAEMDLKQRGAGELSGDTQWGVTDIGMEAIKNIKLVEIAREEAKRIIEKDPELLTYPSIKEKLEKEDSLYLE